MKAQIEIITPAAAKSFLERNTMNRRVSQTTVGRYAADMKADRWNNNGQGIVVSIDGELLDGQHRMHAIIAAQKSIGMLVVRGVPKESFATMDTGKARSFSDLLSIQGYHHTNTLAGAARSAYNYVSGVGQTFTPTKATMDAFVAKHSYLQDTSSLLGNCPKITQRAPFASVLFLGNYRRCLDDEVKSFLDGVIYGEGMRRGDPRHTLREWIAAERIRARGKLPSEAVFAAVGRSWNAWASGKELAVIKGVSTPTIAAMSIFGFERADFSDVPDLVVRKAEVSRGNLANVNALRRPTVERAAPYFAAAGR